MNKTISITLFILLGLGPFYPAFSIPSSFLYLTSTGIIFVGAILLAISDRCFVFRYFPVILFASGVLFFLPIFYKGYTPLLLEFITSGILGYVAFRYLRFSSAFLFYIYTLCAFFIGYFLQTGTLEDVFVPNNGAGDGLSKNFVQISLLHLYLIYYILCLRGNTKPRHFPLYIFPFIALSSAGAGSTAVSVMLLLGFLLIKYRISFIQMAVVLAGIALAVISSIGLLLQTELAARVDTGFVGLDRVVLLARFIDGMDATTVLAGYDETVTFAPGFDDSHASRNLHNSYLNLYRDVGVSAILYVSVVLYIAFHTIKVNGILALLFIGSLIRSISDGYYFNWYFIDFILFYLLLMTPLGKKICGKTFSGQ